MFQFHNGTINTAVFVMLLFLCLCFNSTTVQLIRPQVDQGRGTPTFQFHNGTINTKIYTEEEREKLFQFHNGTINTIRKATKRSVRHVSIPQRYN